MTPTSRLLGAFLLTCLLSGFTLTQNSHAQTKRALLIGINDYAPPADYDISPLASGARQWKSLDGAVNDAEAMRSILQARGFKPDNIKTLQDEEATRQAILDAIAALVASARSGDTVFFFYAGHGSQVKNEGSAERDQLDESIVPADSYRGVPDIRDKELRRAFLPLSEKNVTVTLFFDSCHSGSITRGHAGKSRSIKSSNEVVNDPADVPAPDSWGALVISSAQDTEVAREYMDDNDLSRGAFSWAFMSVLQTSSTNEPVDRLFAKARALLQSEGFTQEPVLAGSLDRRNESLFGEDASEFDGTVVDVIGVDEYGDILLQGGLGIGLREGTELIQLPDSPDAPIDTLNAPRLRIREALGLARSTAEIIRGSEDDVTAGQQFVVDRWIAGGDALLRLYRAPVSSSEVTQQVGDATAELAQHDDIVLVSDPTEEEMDHLVEWTTEGWVLTPPSGEAVALGSTLNSSDLIEKFETTPARVFLSLPTVESVESSVPVRLERGRHAIKWVDNPRQAHYLLMGRISSEGTPEFAWVLRTAVDPEDQSAAPARSDWQDVTKPRGARTLARYVATLEKVWGWLNLESPPDNGAFPYSFGGFEDVETGDRYFAGDELKNERRYRLVLSTTEEELESAQSAAFRAKEKRRYIYLFVIDQSGAGSIIFPANGENVENDISVREGPPPELALPGGNTEEDYMFYVTDPLGLDTYFILTTADPIPDPDIFTFASIATRGDYSGEKSLTDLANMFYRLGNGIRGEPAAVPTGWSVERVTVRSVE